MTSRKLTKKLSARLGILAAGAALGALVAGSALADPAVIYDLGGKFDKSFNEAAYNGATKWSEETGVSFLDLELQNDAQREQALRQFARREANPIVVPGFSWGVRAEKGRRRVPGHPLRDSRLRR